ncbi:peptidoglycan DD-metalloendopeptidase family protein [Trinickia caryophylli]|uniref:Murein DD-endopeptidase MepM and murein hydrolase activator NlpD, contain LysM domain n=1 Tax=Trinickia caryophylli TaxID=28094 RepID=A0A1X7E182_TRICW|nr:peptidoglycan DD-metalloendopeptidase family protein [Trinickia caryophylli]PMS14053.1 LysM peptidoglycan-binding domain-containing protein [Trinickia caryophylli]TRX17749.1 peptidoglycan DD-metalloendopeptidase family protein [Trinickia caryophylli]WQE11488.1 peptidoglycan DD-metalloendopeptidase family protein [Trinickia caryophylli]SMF25607.1 Murein DD-endopeptidase MepM and murein hydrolase activator NlpD, contain LysM domain [Trinickia caryophylli]GLU32653.1 peptidoglycan-binding prote
MLKRTMKRLAALLLAAWLAACGTASVAPGYYRVERGDTLTKIARSHRESVQNIVRWNNLSNPDAIEVGQVLRVEPPGRRGTAGESRASASAGTRSPVTENLASAPTSRSDSSVPAGRLSLIWPAQGSMVRGFNGVNSKGIDIANAAGTPVVAAANGIVVYAGNGLRGYGNLLILKHNADYLTAYAHNNELLVKEGESVKQGQEIATMGNTDNDRVALHFELRYKGQSIDPIRYLPSQTR